MKLTVHLTFAGQCDAAFRFYEHALGGTDRRAFRWGDAPGGEHMPPDWLVHASLRIGPYELMGADVPAPEYTPPRGVFVFYAADTPAEAERVFAALADGGATPMPLQKTFWSPLFGVVTDRFGVPWEITVTEA